MALCNIQFFGNSIEKAAQMNVILPKGKGPFPVLYLLHGLSDDFSAWLRYTSLERYLENVPLIVVMPDGQRSFYCNDPAPYGMAFEDHIIKDVVGFVDATFPTIPSRHGRALAGLSMGGWGAVMLSMLHPDMFCAAGAHSGAVMFMRRGLKKSDPWIEYRRRLPLERYDTCDMAAKLMKAAKGKSARRKPPVAVRMDCGTEDFLIQENRNFHAALDAIGYAHEYKEYPGSHNWAYWDAHIQETIQFVMKHVRNGR